MAKFKDAAGREWEVAINVGLIKKVRELTGVSIGRLGDDRFRGLAELLADPETLCNVLFVLCSDQCKERGLSDEDFGGSLDGDSFEAAVDAFYLAFTNFSPSRVRTLLTDLARKHREIQVKAAKSGEENVAAIDTTEMARALVRDLTSNGSAGNSPASSALTPAPALSGN